MYFCLDSGGSSGCKGMSQNQNLEKKSKPETENFYEEYTVRIGWLEITAEPEGVIIGFPNQEIYTTVKPDTFVAAMRRLLDVMEALYNVRGRHENE